MIKIRACISLALVLFIVIICTSCANTKKIVYFNNIQDTTIQTAVVNLEPVIKKGDILSITVSSLNPEASFIFNSPNTPSSSLTSSTIGTGPLAQAVGYLVNQDGTIQYPILGNIRAAGITKKQLKDSISQKLLEKKLLVDPIVSI